MLIFFNFSVIYPLPSLTHHSIIDRLADLFYACVSGCMTAQTAVEHDYQLSSRQQMIRETIIAEKGPAPMLAAEATRGVEAKDE